MIMPDELTQLLRRALPDARVDVRDRTGTRDHYNIHIASAAFAGLPLLDQHRLVYRAVQAALADGRLHAIEIETEIRAKENR